MVKRLLALLLCGALLLSASGCNKTQEPASSPAPAPQKTAQPADPAPAPAPAEPAPQEKLSVNLAALKGPTALGMLSLLQQNDAGEAANHYQLTLAGAADEIVGKLINGELDIAAVPTNVAATLYNKTQGKVQLAALNTLGVLYILEKGDSVQSVADLAGKTLLATGQGSTPEYALNLILEKNGLSDSVTVEYKSEHSEIPPLLLSGEADLALLPQPFVTSVLSQSDDIRVALDITEEWDKAVEGQSQLTMGCIVVRKDFAQEQPEALDAFLDEYKASVEAVNSDPAAAAQLAEQYDILKAAVAEKAIPACNIVYIDGDEMEQIASGFLTVLYDANPKSVGGSLPDEAFYYKR